MRYGLMSLGVLLSAVGLAGCSDSDEQKARTAGVPAATGTAADIGASSHAVTAPRKKFRSRTFPGPIQPAKKVPARLPTQVVGGPLFIRTKTFFDPSAPPDLTVVLLVKLNRDPRFPNPGVEGTFNRGEYDAGNPAAPGDAGSMVDMADDGGLLRGAGKNCFIGIVYEDSGFLAKRFGALAPGAPITVRVKPRTGDGRVFRFQTPLIDEKLDLNGTVMKKQIKSIGCNAPNSLGDLLP